MNKRVLGTITAVAILAAIGCLVMWISIQWVFYRDITSVAIRAYSASTASESVEYLHELKRALVDRHLDEGYTAFFFNSPVTDLSKKMRQLDSAISRMEALAAMEATGGQRDMAYQMGMQEMIEELSGPNGITGQYAPDTLAWRPMMKWGLWFWGLVIASIFLWAATACCKE